MRHPFDGLVIPEGGFRVGYCDPPWHFEVYSLKGKSKVRHPSAHYETMSLDRICQLPMADIMARDAVLFMWISSPMLPHALRVLDAWGFTFKTVGFLWVKMKRDDPRFFYASEDSVKTLGYHTRSGSEQCWIASRGRGYSRMSKREPQLVFAPRREHSRKPDEIAESIVRLTGDLPRIELFARTQRPGWSAWGNETEKFNGKEQPVKTSDVKLVELNPNLYSRAKYGAMLALRDDRRFLGSIKLRGALEEYGALKALGSEEACLPTAVAEACDPTLAAEGKVKAEQAAIKAIEGKAVVRPQAAP